MKTLALLVLLLLLPYNVHGGQLIDSDGDGLYCVLEDDGKYCGEDDQDKCDGIPNVSRDDFHCSVDVNGDGLFTRADIDQVQSMPDHFLGTGFAPFVCYYMLRVIEYNRRLALAGLPPLQRDLLFLVVSAGAHCYGHHKYPPIL